MFLLFAQTSHIIVMQASDKRTMLAQIKKQRIVNSGNTTHMKSDTINTRSNFGQQDEGILLDVWECIDYEQW